MKSIGFSLWLWNDVN